MKTWLKAMVMLLIVAAVCVVGYFRFVYVEPGVAEDLASNLENLFEYEEYTEAI